MHGGPRQGQLTLTTLMYRMRCAGGTRAKLMTCATGHTVQFASRVGFNLDLTVSTTCLPDLQETGPSTADRNKIKQRCSMVQA
jgi:hypothetical protein